jgi:prolyl-tRNA editing enzyme YbaK/EbsC (Cys-tRNA(Pro) deacylase)
VQTWTPDDLQVYLTVHGIPAEIVHLPAETPTVPAAAAALGVPVDQVVKTVIFLVDEKPYAVYANGVRRVDPRKLAARFGVNRKKVKLADEQVVIALTGYAPGTVPPFGHRQPFPALIDPAVCSHEIVYAGGGGITTLLRLRSDDLLRLTGAETLNVLEDPPNSPDSHGGAE